jgi:hypothetical protein
VVAMLAGNPLAEILGTDPHRVMATGTGALDVLCH